MSLPVSKILKTSKSIMAIADLKNNSPSQNVNISITTPIPDKAVSYPDSEQSKINASIDNSTIENSAATNPYNTLTATSASDLTRNAGTTRDISSATQKTEEISNEIKDKDNTIKALTLIIDILQNNPLIKNEYVIAETETLAELIRLLTSSENVEIEMGDIECSCSKTTYRNISHIYITKDGELYEIQQCPALIRLFNNYKISLLLVI